MALISRHHEEKNWAQCRHLLFFLIFKKHALIITVCPGAFMHVIISFLFDFLIKLSLFFHTWPKSRNLTLKRRHVLIAAMYSVLCGIDFIWFIIIILFNFALYFKSERSGFNLRQSVRLIFFVPCECCGTKQKARFGFVRTEKTESVNCKWWMFNYSESRVESVRCNDWWTFISVVMRNIPRREGDVGGWRSPRLQDRHFCC